MAFIHTSNLPVRKTRGPLRALHNNNIAPDLDVSTTPKHNKDSDHVDSIKGETTHTSGAVWTPVQRATQQKSLDRRRSLQNTFPLPLRTSSCRASKSSKATSMHSTSDIRNHFRVRGVSFLNSAIKSSLSEDDNAGESSSGTSNQLTDSSCFSIASTGYVSAKRRGSDGLDASLSAAKQPRHSNSTIDSAEIRPVHTTMGAFVKAHPRYYRRRSSADPVEQQTHSVSMYRRLSPICPVPMPSGFPSLLPTTYTAVSLPWELGRAPAQKRTVETQTTPPSSTGTPCSTEETHPKSLRPSFGSSQVMSSLRRTFGNLRRAISAERLHRSSRGSLNKSHPELLTKATDSPSMLCKSANLSIHGKLKFRRVGSRKMHLSRRPHQQSTNSVFQKSEDYKHSAPCRLDCASLIDRDPAPSQVGLASLTGRGSPLEDTTDGLTYHVLSTYPDGSIRLQLRRASAKNQFGFFIARDTQGVFISRLGSVRCTVKLWDVLHVGDRLLEVQGVPCSKLEVEDVQNLIRGCELVEFRVQSACVQR